MYYYIYVLVIYVRCDIYLFCKVKICVLYYISLSLEQTGLQTLLL